MKNFKFKWLLLSIVLSIASINTAWAERWVSKCNIKYYTHNGYEQTHDGWYNNDGIDISSANVTINFGNLTQFYLKESWAKGSWDNNYGTAGCKMIYGFSADNQTDYALDWGDQTGDNPKHYGFPISEYNVISHAPNNPGQNTLYVYYHLNYNRGDGGDRKSKTLYINFTIPGFSGAPASKSFGTSIPVNTESETTISFTHYGNALEVGDCSLSNATDFEIRSISESGVNVIFKPTTTGDKSSTLTITDDHGKTCTITLSGTAVAKGTTTRLYFNNFINKDGIKNNSNWTAAGALSRFTVQYTTGVYTHYPMTQCANSTYNYYADVEIKGSTVSVDRYNPSSPYNTWNAASISGINTTNQYAQLDNFDGNFYGFATNHPYNDVSGGNIYYDNSESGLTNTIYLVVGHDYKMTDGGGDTEYSKGYALGNILNTKLYYGTFADTWHDADYYAFIGASSAPSAGEWGSNDLSSKASSSSYTGIFREVMDLESGSSYLGLAPSKTGGALSMTKSPTLNTTQTFNYALSTDGGSSYPALTSGVNTPGKLSMSSFEFTNAKCTTVVAKSVQELAADATTYTKAVSNVAYTGTTVLTESNTRDGYSFIGWYEGNTLLTASAGEKSYTYYPRENKTYTARYKAHRYTINFDANDAQYSSAPAAKGTMDPMTNVVYDQSTTLPSNGFHRIGYKFDGWATTADGSVDYTDEATAVLNLTTTDGGSVTLYAKWSTDVNTFTNETGNGNWNDAGNWSARVVPTNSYAAVQLSGELNVSSYIHVGSMDLTASGAKLTIQAGGTLEVAGTITNTDPSKLVIQTGNEGQGALIYDITQTAPHATVNMTTKNAAGSHYQYIASPIGGVSVADIFSGKGAYTYVWKEGIGWERRGYYDDIAAFEPIALKGKGSCSFVGQLYPGTTSLSLSYTGTPTSVDAQGVNMLANALTAPIKIAAMTISGSSDGSVHVWNNGTWDDYAVSTAGENVIPAMQVYAILASSSGSVSFDYTTAVRGASNKNAALKAPKRITSDIPEHLTISVRTNERDIDLQLYEDEMFTNEIDKGWEAIYMEGDGRFGELYAQADEKMSILATPDLEGTILGFAPGETSDYTISFNGDGKGYYLNDMKELKSTLISEGNTYMFSPDESTNATRFVISRTPIHKVPTGTENVSAGTNARKQMINGTLYIIRDGRIYNAEGALVK